MLYLIRKPQKLNIYWILRQLIIFELIEYVMEIK